jgi:5-methylcytosine-specific restriction endonuclease McrA
MVTRAQHAARKNRESLSKRLGMTGTAIHARGGHECAHCGASAIKEAAAGRHMHLDHIKPESAGGKDNARNLVPACHGCNSARHDMPLEKWAEHAKKHLGINVDVAKIQAQTKQKLPDKSGVQKSLQVQHSKMAEMHDSAAKAGGHPDVVAAHQAAAAVHAAIASRAGEGKARMADMKAARKATAAVHAAQKGADAGPRHPDDIKRDEDGKFASA